MREYEEKGVKKIEDINEWLGEVENRIVEKEKKIKEDERIWDKLMERERGMVRVRKVEGNVRGKGVGKKKERMEEELKEGDIEREIGEWEKLKEDEKEV